MERLLVLLERSQSKVVINTCDISENRSTELHPTFQNFSLIIPDDPTSSGGRKLFRCG